MHKYSTETAASASSHQYSRETVRRDSTLQNVYHIENITDYNHHSQERENELSYNNEYHDMRQYNSDEQPNDYFHPCTSGEKYQNYEYQDDHDSR
uniref:Uncharacterized protein n=1 Tax=Setaria digitata TaxID=48799 RepID=A0A915PYX7_9BILA